MYFSLFLSLFFLLLCCFICILTTTEFTGEKCGREYMRDFRVRTAGGVFEHETGRFCSVPSCKGKLKDTIINFGENLPERDLTLGFEHAELVRRISNKFSSSFLVSKLPFFLLFWVHCRPTFVWCWEARFE
jgi:hypothetical protein